MPTKRRSAVLSGNPRSHMRFFRKARILRVLSSIKRELDQRALAALVDVLDLDDWCHLY